MIAIPPTVADQFDQFLTRKSLPHTEIATKPVHGVHLSRMGRRLLELVSFVVRPHSKNLDNPNLIENLAKRVDVEY